ncbi:hypothetical protein CBM2589_A70083 [Cupriavidus taiwanensis]|uniref:Uncharacterized protein n=1 Tax=Cupriavidus taiwanensis TaxID=164546 RepID=A0A975XCZ2_9BURK|nr:hypothetical protein CBM2589_A70083 [Cupriavidus taiwanensis]
MASRTGDALFASFLSLGQKGGRRLRRRNRRTRQARQTNPAPGISPRTSPCLDEIRPDRPFGG